MFAPSSRPTRSTSTTRSGLPRFASTRAPGTRPRDCAEADLEVLSKKLRATGSWTGKAGKAYRATVTGQQSAIGTAEQGADTMTRGCESAAVAGETFFTELDTAFKSLAKDLPTKADFPE